MKVQLGWLREHVDLPESEAEVAARLTSLGFSVEGIEGEGDACVLDADVTGNRGDATCHVGLARELAAAWGRELRLPSTVLAETDESASDAARVSIEALDLCPRYAARVVRGVRVHPSPAWLASRLEACGLRSLNVVVDVTNYVLLELGHPLHAFDLDRLAGRAVVVRRARAGERLRTLDGQDRSLVPDDLLIADAEGAVALAGVMGGADSEIRDETRDVLLESAWFDPAAIRRTSRRLGLRSEASMRFERGADLDVIPDALDRAASLLSELAGGSVLRGRLDSWEPSGLLTEVRLRHARLRSLSGVDVPREQVQRILDGLGFAMVESDAEGWVVRVPRRRPDVALEVDLIEEVLRHAGYDRVPELLPGLSVGAAPREPAERGITVLRRTLAAAGHQQAITYSFVHPDEAATWADSIAPESRTRALVLTNPLTEDQSVMRTSLVPGLLGALARSVRRGEPDVRLFEEGRIYLARAHDVSPRTAVGAASPAEERRALAVVQTGRRGRPHFLHRPPLVDLLSLKGAIVEALAALRGRDAAPVAFRAGAAPNCAPGGSAEIVLEGRRVGWMGRVHPDLLAGLEVDQPVLAAEVDLEPLVVGLERRPTFQPLSRFPRIVRDVSVLVDRSLPLGDILAAIEGLREAPETREAAEAMESLELVDRWLGEGVPEDKVSLTFSVAHRRQDRTLTQAEADDHHARLVALLERRFGAVRR